MPLSARRATIVEAVREGQAQGHQLTDGRGSINHTAVSFSVFKRLLDADGIRSALYALVRTTDFRYISIFRFRDGRATSVVHVDRENLNLTQADEIADTDTYCCFVKDSAKPFVTVDAKQDERAADHVARDAVQSYFGVPIFHPEGEFIGTLCMYDLCPRDAGKVDLDLLVQASSAIEQSGLVPEYPT